MQYLLTYSEHHIPWNKGKITGQIATAKDQSANECTSAQV